MGADLPGLPEMAALMRDDEGHKGAEADTKPSRKRSGQLRMRQVDAIGRPHALPQFLLHREKIGDDSRQWLVVGRSGGSGGSQPDRWRRLGDAHYPTFE